MSRQLMAINVVLATVSALCIAYVVRQLMLPMAMPVPHTRVATGAKALSGPEPPRLMPGAYGMVVARNVFSPTRTEGTSTTAPGGVIASPAVKPNLFGIVLREGGAIAYLEDPTTRRVAGYRVGDAIAGGTVESIGNDNVVIARPDGRMDVRLHDVTRVRSAQPVPGLPPGVTPPGGFVPGTMPPGAPTPTVPIPGQPGAGATAPGAPLPTRRPPAPNLLRRAPTIPPSDAPRQ